MHYCTLPEGPFQLLFLLLINNILVLHILLSKIQIHILALHFLSICWTPWLVFFSLSQRRVGFFFQTFAIVTVIFAEFCQKVGCLKYFDCHWWYLKRECPKFQIRLRSIFCWTNIYFFMKTKLQQLPFMQTTRQTKVHLV